MVIDFYICMCSCTSVLIALCVILYFTVVPAHRRFKWDVRDLFRWSGRGYRDEPYPKYKPGRETGLPPPTARAVEPDPDFRDEDLERIISDGKLSYARRYLQDQVEMAKQMRDKQAEINYRQYESKIYKAAMRPKPLKPWDADVPEDGEDRS